MEDAASLLFGKQENGLFHKIGYHNETFDITRNFFYNMSYYNTMPYCIVKNSTGDRGERMAAGLIALAFALFFLGDWNDWRGRRPALRLCFPAGFAALTVSAVLSIGRAKPFTDAVLRVLAGLVALTSLALLVYTLFFAIPAGDAYVRQGEKRPACTTGVYALCRHPGVWWLLFLYLGLWGSAGVPPVTGLAVTALNVLLVLFEDRLVFPARLSGYGPYRRATPFLIPNLASVRACFSRRG